MKKSHPRRIGPRITAQLLLLLGAVFAGVFLTFNLFFKGYVAASARSQLDAIQTELSVPVRHDGDMERDGLPELDKAKEPFGASGQESEEARFPNMSLLLGNTIRSEATVFNLDGAYQLTDYNRADDPAALGAIAAELAARGVSLADARYVSVRTAQGDYEVSSMVDPVLPETYMVFALDMSALHGLQRTVNAALALIMAAAGVICVAITAALTRTVTVPVRQLCAFAERLGSGDFKKQETVYRDAEFAELADAMNCAADKLDQYDTEQRTFFQNVSHELRTPLMSIRCYAEGISCGVMEPKKSGEIILTETDRLSVLVEDLLYISRIDRSPAPEKMQRGDLRETVSMCATSLQAVAGQRGVSFCYAFSEEPVCFLYNENHLYRAVSNLISNALRYARTTVTLGCRQTDAGVEISVIDDGPGVCEQDLPHVFERFYKGAGGKAGIGLALVKSVAELYGGTVAVEPGPGGRFFLRLPAEKP